MRLLGKRFVSAAVAVPALVLLLAASRTWLSGRSTEPLLGGGTVAATGSQVAPGVVALGLVAIVALVSTLTGGRVVRRIGAGVMLLAALGAVVLSLPPLTDPQTALGRVAATGLGRTGVVPTTADVSPWAWLALVAAVLLTAAAGLAVVAAGRWTGLSRRFDAPAADAATPGATTPGATDGVADAPPAGTPAPTAAGERGTRRTAWDELSEGRDPTEDEVDGSSPHRSV